MTRTAHARLRGLEQLEPRLLLSIAPEEQLFVYLLNRARHDPVAYQQEDALPVDLSYVTPRGPLAVNNDLFDSAEFHAVEMATHNYFNHQSEVTGQWPNQMARNEGYVLPAAWPNDANYIESIAAGTVYDTAGEPLADLIVDQGVPSLGHRNHLLGIDAFNANNREIGVGHAFNGAAFYDHYWAIHATRSNENDRFLTGVVFNDANGNGRYDLNEGLSNVTVTAGSFTTSTNAAGGWSIKVPTGTYLVMASGGAFAGTSVATATVGSENAEVDFISGMSQGIVNFSPPPPAVPVSIGDASALEGTGGTTNLVFNVTLASASSQPVLVSYSTAGGSAQSGGDFAPAAGTLTFLPGTLTQQLSVTIYADVLVESNETFTVNLSNPVGATLADGLGVGTIDNDDITYSRPNEILVVAPGAGHDSTVRVLDQVTGEERYRFLAFGPFAGGVQVATGDVNKDSVLDIIVAAGAGGGPHIRVFDGTTGAQLAGPAGSFFAYAPAFTGGVFVASADFNADGHADIVTGPGTGGGPHVRIFSGANGAVLGDFFAYAPAFFGGVRVAAGDVSGDGTPDVVTAAGPGGGPHVRVFSGATATPISGPAASFFAYAPGFTGGVYIAAGDVNGDGRADIITGAGAGGGPHVRVISGLDASTLHSFFAYAEGFRGGVRVGVGQFDGDGRVDIITAAGPGGGPHVRVFEDTTGQPLLSLFAFEAGFIGGVFVAGSLETAGPIGIPILGPTTASATASPATALLPPSEPAVDILPSQWHDKLFAQFDWLLEWGDTGLDF